MIELRSVMDTKNKGTGDGLSHKMSLEEVLPILNSSKTKSFSVVNEKNENLGSVNLDSAIKALARADNEEVAERYK